MSENKTKAQQLQELKDAQLSGNAPTIAANKDSNYQIAEAEKDYLHVALKTRTNNPVTQEYDENERVLALRPEEYESMKKTGSFDGYHSQTIVHDPRTKTQVKEAEKELEENPLVSNEPDVAPEPTPAPAAKKSK